jgi:hypothetical protein
MKDATLGGYLQEHERPPAFTGPEGESYTVEILTERQGDGAERWGAYLFFLRWRGRDAVGHVESGFLAEAETEEEVRAAVERLTLHEVKRVLEELVTG